MRVPRALSGRPLTIIRLALLGASFGIAYRGQRLFETQEDLRMAGILFLVASLPLITAWFLGQRPESADQAGAKTDALPDIPSLPDWVGRTGRALLPYWPLVAVLALATALRFYQLGSLPFGVTFDEAQNGIEARRILHDPNGYHPVFIPGASQVPALFFYVFALSMRIFGETVMALRTATTLSGIVAVAGLYFLGRELFGHRVGLIAAFLLAVMRWHLNFSRIAFLGSFSPTFMILALYFLVRGGKGHSWWNYVVSGILVGMGLQGYYSFVFVPVIMVAYWVHRALLEERKQWLPLANGLLVVAITSGIVVLPLVRYVYENPDQATERTQTVTITKDKSFGETMDTVARTTKIHALMFNVTGDANGRHNLPHKPMVDRFTGMFFLLGIAMALTRPHRSAYFLLVIWLAVLMQGGIWSLEGEAPQGYRTFMVAPAIALLAALPLALLADIALGAKSWSSSVPSLRRALTRLPRSAASALLPAVAGLGLLFLLAQVAYHNYNTFFNRQIKDATVWAYFDPIPTIVGRELDRLGDSVLGYSSATLTNPPTTMFLAPDAAPLMTFALPLDAPFQAEKDVVVFLDGVDGRDAEAAFWLQRAYPGAQFIEHHPPGQLETTVLYEVLIPREVIDASYGVDAIYTSLGGVPLVRREASLAFDWRAATPVPVPFMARWATTLKVTTGLDRGLRAEAPGHVRLVMDQVVVAEGDGGAEVRGDLALGLHDLTIEAQVTGPGEVRLLALTTDGAWQSVPPQALFRLPIGAHGLTGTYYTIADISAPLNPSGPPVERRVDPYVSYRYHVSPISQWPFMVVWTGKLTVPAPGGYRLALDNLDDATLLVDGQPYLDNAGNVGLLEGTTELAAGVHEIELRYAAYTGSSHVLFYWVPPDQPPVIVPFENLTL